MALTASLTPLSIDGAMPRGENKVSFRFEGKVNGVKVDKKHVPVKLLAGAAAEISALIEKGTEEPTLSIEDGSVILALFCLGSHFTGLIERHADSPERMWNEDASVAQRIMKISGLVSTMQDGALEIITPKKTMRISADMSMAPPNDDIWHEIDCYIRGKVVEMGGAKASNVHIKTATGEILVIAATHDQMRGKNWLYEDVVVHAKALQNPYTEEFKNLKFVKLNGPFSESSLASRIQSMVRASKGRFDGLPPSDEYIKQLRS